MKYQPDSELKQNRDIGASIVANKANVELSIPLMATDAIALVTNLGWKSVDMLGFSMGGKCLFVLSANSFVLLPSCYADARLGPPGFILQQILITPNLPFTVEHAILAATATKPPHADPEFIELSLGGLSRPPGNKLTPEERKQRAISIARQMTELGYDKEWLKVPENQALVEKKIPEAMVARPSLIIGELPF